MLIERLLFQTASNELTADPSALTEQFREALETLAALGQAEGMSLVPYKDASLPAFTALPDQNKQQVVDAVTLYTEVMQSSASQPESLRYNLNSVWRMLGRLRLRPSDDLFENLAPNDIVEIYTVSGLQIFRSFHFFELCSYTLEDLFCIPWFSLFSRPPELDQAFFGHFHRLASGDSKWVGPGELPTHEVRERFGPKSLVNKMEFRLAIPLYGKDHVPRGVLHACRAELVNVWN